MTALSELKQITGDEYGIILERVVTDLRKEENMWYVLSTDVEAYLEGGGKLDLPMLPRYIARYTPYDYKFWQKVVKETRK